MRSRAYRTLVPLLVVAGVLCVSGCNVLKKLKKKPVTTSSDDDTPTTSTFNDIDAVNKADVSRFIDETRLFNETGFIRVLTFARTAPDSGGTIVGVIDPDSLILKHAHRFGNTLVTFNRSAFPGKRFAGWVPDTAFNFPITPTTPTPTPTPQGITGTGGGGTCSMSLRQSNFIPSKSTCSFNESVRSNNPSTLFFPCNGGSATARFGPQTFSGTADKNRVAVSNTVVGTFSGCQIRTTQVISGTPPNLTYLLSESFVGAPCKGINTCTARATVTATQ
ncbi:MAG: hypothetical protein JWO86_5309 [Myxococcaceae bacterium]|nr:hypothetical protein [Myxococcaceae bacterium]MEA2746363.1 hypothetical protein [Myxococcales bacterium]